MRTVKVKRERFGPFRKPTQPIVPESSKYIDTQPKIAQLPIVRRKQSVGNFCLPVRVAFRSLAMGSSLSQVRTKRDRGIFLCTRHKGDTYAASCMKKIYIEVFQDQDNNFTQIYLCANSMRLLDTSRYNILTKHIYFVFHNSIRCS